MIITVSPDPDPRNSGPMLLAVADPPPQTITFPTLDGCSTDATPVFGKFVYERYKVERKDGKTQYVYRPR